MMGTSMSNNSTSLKLIYLNYLFKQENVPGPGHYHNNSTMTSFKHEKKPEKLQYFGSTSIRFKHNKKKTIGPGNYEVTDNYSVN